ncbi:MAG TPA: SDR family NAD(P)-dependent oxidoreductase, partial [Trueperaceae bacterium]
MSSFGLEGRRAVVTGGARGIGLAMARAFADAGAEVVLADRDAATAERAARGLAERGARAWAVPLDVTDHQA